MSQKSSAFVARAGTAGAKPPAEQVVRDIRRATRRQHSSEEKIRIVLEGLRGEDSIAALCRREGIAESLYYSWSKEFLGSAHCAERQAAPDGRHGTRCDNRRGQGTAPGSAHAERGRGRAGARAAPAEQSMTGAGDDPA
jgi:transposase